MKRIIVKNISKKFRIGAKKQSTLSAAKNFLSGREQRKDLWVLKDISFSADEGEVIGIIGENGSGKSTLLRIIARIYNKDGGKIITRGKIVSLIGMNEGLDVRLSTRDNIFLCCSLLGLKQDEIKKRFKKIISFAGLEKFVDTKLYQFSSGMIARLAFSIAIHSINHDPDILLLDEIFAVGDEKFKDKCSEKIKELVKTGSTVLIVSHELDMLKKICKRVIWIEEGKIRKDGGNEILKEYEDYSKDLKVNKELLKTYEEYKRKHEIKKLHFACHKNILDSWFNIEKEEKEDNTPWINVINPLPFEDSSFDYIFLERLLQHYEYEQGLRLLKECFRILKPGGKIRIITPNLDFFIEIYNKKRKSYHKEYISRYYSGRGKLETFVINNIFRGWAHRFIYDFRTLKSSLEESGFHDIEKYNPNKSYDDNLKNLERKGDITGKDFNKMETLIIEATK